MQLKKRLLLIGGLLAVGLLAVGIEEAAIRGYEADGGDHELAAPEAANGHARSEPGTSIDSSCATASSPGFRPDGDGIDDCGSERNRESLATGARRRAATARQRVHLVHDAANTCGRDGGRRQRDAAVRDPRGGSGPDGVRLAREHDPRDPARNEDPPLYGARRPGARGWTGSDLHGNPIGTVQWVQGRCMLVLVSEGDVPFVEVLSTGARAIYERTGGDCP